MRVYKKQLLDHQDCYLSLYQRCCKDAKWESETCQNQEQCKLLTFNVEPLHTQAALIMHAVSYTRLGMVQQLFLRLLSLSTTVKAASTLAE